MPVVAAPVHAGSYLIVPYRWDQGDPSKNETILSHCAAMANLFPLPASAEERKIIIAHILTNPLNFSWEVWRKSPVAELTLVGILNLTNVTPKLDGLAHFVFFDRHLVGRRPLIQTMLTWCFEQLELRRISIEIPEHLEPLIRFARKLGFRYEGETLASQHALPLPKGINNPAQWVARWGSRRERMHCDETGTFHDVICLRLLREEHGVK